MGKARTCQEQAEAKSSKSFLVLFFKKEQKESTSFLKKRSKKLFRMGLRFNGLIDLLFCRVASATNSV